MRFSIDMPRITWYIFSSFILYMSSHDLGILNHHVRAYWMDRNILLCCDVCTFQKWSNCYTRANSPENVM